MSLHRSIKSVALFWCCLSVGHLALADESIAAVASANIQATATVVPGMGLTADIDVTGFDRSDGYIHVLYPCRSGVMLTLDYGNARVTLAGAAATPPCSAGPGEMFVEIPDAVAGPVNAGDCPVLTLVYTEN